MALSSAGEGMFISASADATMKIWDAQLLECKHVLSGHTRSVTNMAHSKEYNCLISAGLDQVGLGIWGLSSYDIQRLFHPAALGGEVSNSSSLFPIRPPRCLLMYSGRNGMESMQPEETHLPSAGPPLFPMRSDTGARHPTGCDGRRLRDPSPVGSP